jgi:hypothetical protein
MESEELEAEIKMMAKAMGEIISILCQCKIRRRH